MLGDFKEVVMPFDEIMDAVAAGRVRAGVIIHEGQLTYQNAGLVKLLDLGQWWLDRTGLPLVLGVNVIKKSLGSRVIQEVSEVLRSSVEFALAHREQALAYAADFGRGIPKETLDKFVSMYVNQWTVGMDERALKSAALLLREASRLGLVRNVDLEPVG